MLDENSMMFWYPKIRDLPIPQPKTVVVPIPNEVLTGFLRNNEMGNLKTDVLDKYKPMIEEAIKKVGLPFFLRTDQASGKHSWKETCYVKNMDDIYKHIYWLLDWHHMVSMIGEITNYSALVFRKFVEMDSSYTAFDGMPVNPERRYFILDGKVVCHHVYWIEDAIQRASVDNWRELSKKMNTETESEITLLTKHAEIVAKKFDGYWSVDFCRAKDGTWHLIDMALGKRSWHPECPNKIKFVRR